MCQFYTVLLRSSVRTILACTGPVRLKEFSVKSLENKASDPSSNAPRRPRSGKTAPRQGRWHSGKQASDWTFFHLVLSAPPDQKTVENSSTLYHPGCGSQVQTETKNWYRKPMRGFNFLPIRSGVRGKSAFRQTRY